MAVILSDLNRSHRLMHHVLEEPLVVHLDLRDHVAGDEAALPVALAPVETVRVFLANNLTRGQKNVLCVFKLYRASQLHLLGMFCCHC